MGASIVRPELRVFPTAEDLAQGAARFIVDQAQEAEQARGVVTLALSGGNTPRATYERLAAPPARDAMPWAITQVFFSDERFVPLDSPQSNYHLAWQTLLSHVPMSPRFVHAVETTGISPQEAAILYQQGIRRVFRVGLTEVPRFDLILLGLGPDGHTASLFPGTAALHELDALVVPNHVPKFESWRITFTYTLINAARVVAFLVEGAGKAEMVQRVLAGDPHLPASRVQPNGGKLVWLLDQAAAAELGEAH